MRIFRGRQSLSWEQRKQSMHKANCKQQLVNVAKKKKKTKDN